MEKMELVNGFSPLPDFFKTYNSQTLISQRVAIPSDYRQYYPTPLPETAILKKADGRFWKVKWTLTEEGAISFEDGWPKFVKDNGVLDGDFLLFMYDGSRTFYVIIYRNGDPVMPEDPINIQEISDDDEKDSTGEDDDGDGDEDDDDDDDEYGDTEAEEESNENRIISLSLGSSDENDVDAMTFKVNRALGMKGGSSQRRRATYIDNPEAYLDDDSNPFFISTSSCTRNSLVIARQAIKDYELKFGDTIKLIDEFGEIEGNVTEWKDRTVVYKWDKISKRNNGHAKDVIICEILREAGLVRSIKVHFVEK